MKSLGKLAYCILGASLLTPALGYTMPGEFPRVGLMWVSGKTEFLENSTLDRLAVADFVIIHPNNNQRDAYIAQVAAAKKVNPELLIFKYINITAYNERWGGWEHVEDNLTNSFVNPDRGSGRNMDGYARSAGGARELVGRGNLATNFLAFTRPYDGNRGVARSDADTSRPKLGETAGDFMSRFNYYNRVEPFEAMLDGVFEDVHRRWPKADADWDNNGRNDGKNESTDPKIASAWRMGHIRGRDNMVGPNFDGKGAPFARENGRAWLENGGYFLGNASAWVSADEVRQELETGRLTPLIPEYKEQLHGGIHEAVVGLENSRGGIAANGRATPYSGFVKNLEAGLVSFNFSLRHARAIPQLGYPAMVFQAHATTLDMARYAFAAALLTDGAVSVHNNESGLSDNLWMLDEYVGANYKSLGLDGMEARRKWLGKSVDAAYPNCRFANNRRVLMREFQNGLVIVLAGRAPNDNHLNAVEEVKLPSPGAGYAWYRIDGGQDPEWNDGSRVGATISMGTTSADINRNAILLKRVRIDGKEEPSKPKSPTILD